MAGIVKSLVKQLPYIRGLHGEIRKLKRELARRRTWQLPGHFYSPIPSLEEVQADAPRIFRNPTPPLAGIALNDARQLDLLSAFASYHPELPEEWRVAGNARYYFENEYYSWADGIVMYCMLRHLQPRRVVEIGCGFSSALMIDTDERFLGNATQCTFVEPYPERLMGLLKQADVSKVSILQHRLQDVDLEVFRALGAGDMLVIDSSHVSKTGSDLNRLLFEVLPQLSPGVYVHFHDIFYPFEYPESWVREGVAWNEAYLLHAFLQYNTDFSIQFFTSYLVQCHSSRFAACLPLAMNSERANPTITDAPGASLWLRKEGHAS